MTGYYRPGRSKLRGQVKFQSGEISPRQFVISRINWSQLSESQHLYRESGMESGMFNCVLPTPHSPIPDPPPVRPHTNEKAGRMTRLSCCGDL